MTSNTPRNELKPLQQVTLTRPVRTDDEGEGLELGLGFDEGPEVFEFDPFDHGKRGTAWRLGLSEANGKTEKHRKNAVIGAPEVRSFLGALRAGDRGIYLSTGGFTREARYESDRANVPVSLMDLDDLARLIETHYEAFDTEGRGLLPLTKVYWPVD